MNVRTLTVAFIFAVAVAAAQTPFAGRKFVIDAGHGGSDPGAVGIDGGAYPNEEDFVLDVAQRLKSKLETSGAEVVLTRSTDATVSLTARRDLTNAEDPDAFLSIHCNSFSDSSAHGTEAFWWTSGNSADQTLASKVQSRMLEAFSLTDRGVKQANFTVITSNPPASLAEMMFISNQAEFDLMDNSATRETAAEAFYKAFADFLGIDLNAPVITTQPSTATVNPGQTGVFSAVAAGSGLAYQWLHNGLPVTNDGRISGATTANLAIANAQIGDAGFYSLRVTGGGTTVFSAEAQLVVLTTPSAIGAGNGLRGTFYDNPDFTALRRARVDATVNFNWGVGSPSSTMQADTFSVRWTGQVEPRYSQTYQFFVRADDGVRLWIGNTLLIDHWTDQAAAEWSASVPLTAGQKYDLRLDYYENTGDALAELRWAAPSQAKEIVPSTQLHRPPPQLAAPPPAFILTGQPFSLTLSAEEFDPLLSSQPWADFENETDGSTDTALFRKPQFSGTTSAFTDPVKTRESTVTASFPPGNSSTRALHVKWSWASGAVNPWLRLTTANSTVLPNPVIDFRKSLRFDVWSEHTLKYALGLRETNSSGAIASDGGQTGTIEFAGVSAVTNGTPIPVRTVSPDVWTTVQFNLPGEPNRAFTGNGVLESTTGLGVLEHLCIAPGSASIDHDVYLDNFVVVEPNRLTYTLINGPAGATVNAATGLVTWNPVPSQAGSSQNFLVQVSDAGSPPLISTAAFSVTSVPMPEVTAVSREGNILAFSWKAASGAKYDIETAEHPAGPWSRLITITATSTVASTSIASPPGRRFFRARWLP